MSRFERGFTLVEVLVVLVITALLSTLLLQALSQVSRLQARFGSQIEQSQGGAMRADWFRQLLQGLKPDYADGPQRFAGASSRIEGLSSSGLSATGGAPLPFTLEIVPGASGGGQLRYRSGTAQLDLIRWRGAGRAEFAYLDTAGTEHAQWPPLSFGSTVLVVPTAPTVNRIPVQQPPQLPAGVLLKWPNDAGGRALLVAVVRGDLETRRRPFQLMVAP
jgi:general secretion pathway protein J